MNGGAGQRRPRNIIYMVYLNDRPILSVLMTKNGNRLLLDDYLQSRFHSFIISFSFIHNLVFIYLQSRFHSFTISFSFINTLVFIYLPNFSFSFSRKDFNDRDGCFEITEETLAGSGRETGSNLFPRRLPTSYPVHHTDLFLLRRTRGRVDRYAGFMPNNVPRQINL